MNDDTVNGSVLADSEDHPGFYNATKIKRENDDKSILNPSSQNFLDPTETSKYGL